jgi:tetratricopeptide (TPR) repeat protein
MSHQLDSSIFGAGAGGPHVVNMLIHLATSILLFVLFKKITGRHWESALVALVFAAHPAHVESVAWVAERKDVLSTLFWVTSTLFYCRYALDKRKNSLLIAVALSAVGLAAKPMLVTMPFTLLLLDLWPLRRWERPDIASLWPLVREKWAFFVLSICSAVITIFAQCTAGAIQSTTLISLPDRLANAVVSYGRYVWMFFVPSGLGAWYPFDPDIGVHRIIISAIMIALVSAAAIWQFRKRPFIFTGWFWFLGTLVPVIGILQVGRQALADRYTYVPYIGLSVAVVWLLAEAAERFNVPAKLTAAVAAVAVTALVATSAVQASYWKNSETIAKRTLAVTEDNYFIETNYCNYLEQQNRLDEARAQCTAAIEHDPTLVQAYNNLGSVQMKQSQFDEAKRTFTAASAIDATNPMTFANLAVVETRMQNFDAALDDLEKGRQGDRLGFFDARRRFEMYSAIGNAAMQQKQSAAAQRAFQEALRASPANVDIQRNLALAIHLQGRSDEALKMLEETSRTNPNSPEVFNTMGLVLAETGRRDEAAKQFQRALQINPNFAPAQNNLKRLTQ